MVARAVARCFRVREAAIFAASRATAREALARHVAIYLAHVALGWPYEKVAARFGRHRSSVAYACARIEDSRDDARFDARIARLERRMADSDRDSR